MQIDITSPKVLGLLIRATRRRQRLRMDDLAGSAGVGPVFVREVERGKETAQFGRIMRVLSELGITLHADASDDVAAEFSRQLQVGTKPVRPRKPSR